MSDHELVRMEGHGVVRGVVIRWPDYAWELEPGKQVSVQVIANDVVDTTLIPAQR